MSSVVIRGTQAGENGELFSANECSSFQRSGPPDTILPPQTPQATSQVSSLTVRAFSGHRRRKETHAKYKMPPTPTSFLASPTSHPPAPTHPLHSPSPSHPPSTNPNTHTHPASAGCFLSLQRVTEVGCCGSACARTGPPPAVPARGARGILNWGRSSALPSGLSFDREQRTLCFWAIQTAPAPAVPYCAPTVPQAAHGNHREVPQPCAPQTPTHFRSGRRT